MANLITLSRFPLLVLVMALLYPPSAVARWTAVGLLFVLIMMDTIDGFVARRRGESSLLGSVLDIAADRTVEIVLWVCFADLGLIPLAIPIVVIIRGTVVDGLRCASAQRGQTPFSVTASKWGKRIVASPAMRTSYGVAKGVAFCGLAVAQALRVYSVGSPQRTALDGISLLATIMSWVAATLCVVRAIPVFIEAPSSLRQRH